MTFDELGLAPEILRAVTQEGYVDPTPVQELAIPHVLAGRERIEHAVREHETALEDEGVVDDRRARALLPVLRQKAPGLVDECAQWRSNVAGAR
jgi:hypothetical protein